jgi:cytosine/adenosine deaminase-related metal-dependent hydrolase
MPRVDAVRLDAEGPRTLRLDVEGTVLLDVEETAATREPSHCLIKAPLNAHTHVGDAFLTGQVPEGSLDEIVAPLHGFKHRQLASADPTTVADGIQRVLREYAATGTRRLIDFREGGVDGIRLVRSLATGGLDVHLLGRPGGEDLDAVVSAADGIGFPSYTDDPQAARQAAEAAHAAGKPLALHASEAVREPIEEVLVLEPDLLVHLAAATDADVARVVDADVPVAVCPSSNRRFGLRPPVPRLLELGARWALGTDNAMFGSRSVVEEAAFAQRMFPQVPQEALVAALEADGFEQVVGLDVRETDAWLLVPMDPAGRIQWWEPALRLREGPNTAAGLRRRIA